MPTSHTNSGKEIDHVVKAFLFDERTPKGPTWLLEQIRQFQALIACQLYEEEHELKRTLPYPYEDAQQILDNRLTEIGTDPDDKLGFRKWKLDTSRLYEKRKSNLERERQEYVLDQLRYYDGAAQPTIPLYLLHDCSSDEVIKEMRSNGQLIRFASDSPIVIPDSLPPSPRPPTPLTRSPDLFCDEDATRMNDTDDSPITCAQGQERQADEGIQADERGEGEEEEEEDDACATLVDYENVTRHRRLVRAAHVALFQSNQRADKLMGEWLKEIDRQQVLHDRLVERKRAYDDCRNDCLRREDERLLKRRAHDACRADEGLHAVPPTPTPPTSPPPPYSPPPLRSVTQTGFVVVNVDPLQRLPLR